MKRTLFAALMFVAWALPVRSQIKNTTGIEFVQIQPGEFMMGCSEGDADCKQDERPIHRVQITKPFQIGKYELTQAQWVSVMGSNPSTIKGDDHPVETVSKDEVHEFLDKVNSGNDGYHYRLPTEAEWEYAARAGTTAAYAGPLDEIAWYSGNSEDETHPVGKKQPNAWGLYDMEGNVKEFVEDLYGANYYSSSPAADPAGPPPGAGGGGRGGFGGRGPRGQRGFGGPGFDPPPQDPNAPPPADAQQGGGRRRGPRGGFGVGRRRDLPVMRGGGWDNPAAFLRVSARYSYYGSTFRASDLGFRVVREPVN